MQPDSLTMPKIKKKNYLQTIGRRRRASARVRLFSGESENTVNGIVIGKYFTNPLMVAFWMRPFDLTGTKGKYYVTAKVEGGGKQGQLNAVVHGIARALAESNPDFRSPLKKAGLLTRDPRKRERRKIGTGGKARRAKQSPKR